MAKKEILAGQLVSFRASPDALRRVDALTTRIARDRTIGALGRVTRSTVLKLALMHGLDALEQQYK